MGNTQVTLNTTDSIAHGKTALTASDVHSFYGFTYRGYYYDKDISLYYLINRYYDPTTGRFISADDTQYLDFATLFGYNRYAYCKNNPIRFIDPKGNEATTIIVILVIIAVLAIAATVAYGAITKEPVVIDLSFTFVPLGIIDIKLGIAIVLNFEEEYIEFYPHGGFAVGPSSGFSLMNGKLFNYNSPGDCEGNVVTIGGGIMVE